MTIETSEVVTDIDLPSLAVEAEPAPVAPVGESVDGVPVEDLVVGLVRLVGDGLTNVAKAGGALKSGSAYATQAVNAVGQVGRSAVAGFRHFSGSFGQPPKAPDAETPAN